MIERIYIGCCATDVWLARISVASIRYWHPEIPICLLRDHGRGRFETSEIEKCWSVEAIDSEPCYSGWGYTKLELLFRPLRERFLFVDADTAFVGPLLEVLDARPEQFIVSPDVIDDPQIVHNDSVALVDHGSAGRVRAARPAARFGVTPAAPGSAAPQRGEHGTAVMTALGFTEAEIAGFAADGSLKA